MAPPSQRSWRWPAAAAIGLGHPIGRRGRGIQRREAAPLATAPRRSGLRLLAALALGRLALAAARCEDEPGFRDQNGLLCSSWDGLNCSSEEHLAFDFYSPQGLKDVQGNCTVSCKSCIPPAFVLSVEGVRVMRVQLEFAGATGLTPLAFQESIGAAMGVSTDNVTELNISSAAEAGKVLASCRVVLPAGMSLRLSLNEATGLTSASETTGAALLSSLAGKGLPTTSADFSIQHVSLPKLEKVTLLRESENLTTIGIFRMSLQERAWCADDPTFLDEQNEGCEAWAGYDCTDERRWAASERPYTSEGLYRIRKWCGASCGLCQKPGPAPKEQLLASCEDDARHKAFCSRWAGLNCEWAYEMGYPEHYERLLLERCPKTCGLCTPADASASTCADTPGFVDQQGRSCSAWSAPGCFYEQSGYTRQGVLDVQANCPMSCGMCSSAARMLRPTAMFDQCEDDPSYSYLKLFQCSDFVGKSCTIGTLHLDQRWMTTPEGSGVGPQAVWRWHEPLWKACPLSCGLCDPPQREAPVDLLIECEDDRHLADWCAFRWQNQTCAAWQSTITLALPDRETEKYNTTLFDRCPSTCSLCTPPVCGPGTRRDKVNHVCTGCELGRYAAGNRSGPAAVNCTAAMPGDYVDVANATEYSRCAPGFFSALSGSSSCEACPLGKFSDQFSASVCQECDAGWYQDATGSSGCKRCERGVYSNETGSAVCTECPLDRTTFWLSATDIMQCGCPEGTYQPRGRVEENCEPCPYGMRCPGGHPYLNASVDMTGRLLEGFMTLPEDPYVVYSCWDAANTCPGERPVISDEAEYPAVCADGRVGVRCAGCLDNHWQKGYSCLKCEDSKADVAWKAVLFILLQFYAIANAYRKQGKETTAAWMMLMSFISFMQVLQSLSKIPVEWPKELLGFFKALNLFSIPGVFRVFEFRQECVLGTSTMALMLRDALMPLLLIANFVVIWLFFRCTRRKLYWPFVYNVIASVIFGLFMSICTMAMQMFPAEKMPDPNPRWFVRALPGTELYGEEWYSVLPISVVAVALYCGGAFIYTTRAVLLAPRRVCECETFAEQYDFILGDMNPKAWWWILVSMMNMIILALIQVIFSNVFMQLYLSMLVLSVTILLQIAARPNMHKVVNNVEITLAVTNLIFLVFATAFIKEADLLQQDTHVHAVIMVGIIACVTFLTLFSIYWWIKGALRQSAIGKAASEVYRSRDLMLLLALLPEGKFLSLSSRMIETDRLLLKRTTDMLVATFLQEQPGKHFFRQRVIPGRDFTIWTPRKTASATHQSVRSKTAHSVLEENRRLRMNVQILRDDLRAAKIGPKVMGRYVEVMNHQVKQGEHGIVAQVRAAKDRFLAALGKTQAMIVAKHVAAVFFGDSLASKMTVGQFLDRVRDISRLSEADLMIIFYLFDVSGSGKVPIVDFFDLVEAMAHEQEAETPTMELPDTEEPEAEAQPEAEMEADAKAGSIPNNAQPDGEHEDAEAVDKFIEDELLNDEVFKASVAEVVAASRPASRESNSLVAASPGNGAVVRGVQLDGAVVHV